MHVSEPWDDIVVRQAFEDTIFGSLAEQSYKPKRKWFKAAKRLLRAVGIDGEATASEIQRKLEEILADPNWHDLCFSRAASEGGQS